VAHDALATRLTTTATQTDGLEALAACLEQLAALHDHLCPRQVLGVRMGLHGGEVLGLDLPRRDKRLLAFVETDGCLADSISVATGCWLGRRTMRLVDHGKIAATLVDTTTGRAIRVSPRLDARVRAAAWLPNARSRWHAQRDAYRSMPTAELLRTEEVTLALDLGVLISRKCRSACASCGEDIINERETHIGDRPYCRTCAGERYYHPRPDRGGAVT